MWFHITLPQKIYILSCYCDIIESVRRCNNGKCAKLFIRSRDKVKMGFFGFAARIPCGEQNGDFYIQCKAYIPNSAPTDNNNI